MLIGAVMVAILALTLTLIQQQFNEGDHHRAIELVASHHPGSRWSIGQELVAQTKGGTPDCRSKILSSFRGTLEVTCDVAAGQRYRFHVDLVRRTVEPADPASRELMEQAAEKNRSLSENRPDASCPANDGVDGGR